jgi:hypothetical protein
MDTGGWNPLYDMLNAVVMVIFALAAGVDRSVSVLVDIACELVWCAGRQAC